jgi:hypothetical protein
MNIDDLRQTLTTMADEVHSLDETSRLRAVDAKVARVRRQRIGAGVACAAAATVVGLVVPGLVNPGGGGPKPANHPTTHSPRTSLPTIEDKGARFYTSPAGDTLLGEAMGRAGAHVVTLHVVPTTTDLSYRSVCWRLVDRDRDGRLAYDVTVNGHPLVSASCDTPDHGALAPDSRFGNSPSSNSNAWTNAGVVPGKPMTLRISLRPGVAGQSAAKPTQLGIALYADTGSMVRDHGVWLDRQEVVDGHTYQLVRQAFSRVRGLVGHLSLDLPRESAPLYLVYGVGHARGGYQTAGDGSGSRVDQGGASTEGQLSRPGQQVSRLSIHLLHTPGSLIYILAYRQVD